MSEYLVNSAEQVVTKNGKKYLRMKLFAPGGKIWPAIWWDDREPPPAGKVVDVFAEIDSYQGQEQLKISALRILDKDPSDVFLPKTAYNIDELYAELVTFSKSVDGKLGELLYRAVGDPRWKRSPAAQTIHHAVLGGLLEHTVNLCRLGDAVSKLYPDKINRNYMICAAILHDIGKMDELNCTTTIEYSVRGNLEGHIVIGLLRVNKWMEELEFDEHLRMIVSHLVLSHHGQQAFGSPKSPAILEAQIFNNLDGLDANMGKITAAIEKVGPDKEWTEPVNYKEKFYVGKKT